MVGPDYDEGYAYMALCCWDLNKPKEFMKYLEEAVRRNPQEAGIVLSSLFPEGMEPKDYTQFMKDKLSL